MSKNIRVYLYDADPSLEPFRFRTSRDDALRRVSLNAARWIRKDAIQLRPPPDWIPPTLHTGLFAEVWRVKPSECYLVWQIEAIK